MFEFNKKKIIEEIVYIVYDSSGLYWFRKILAKYHVPLFSARNRYCDCFFHRGFL